MLRTSMSVIRPWVACCGRIMLLNGEVGLNRESRVPGAAFWHRPERHWRSFQSSAVRRQWSRRSRSARCRFRSGAGTVSSPAGPASARPAFGSRAIVEPPNINGGSGRSSNSTGGGGATRAVLIHPPGRRIRRRLPVHSSRCRDRRR